MQRLMFTLLAAMVVVSLIGAALYGTTSDPQPTDTVQRSRPLAEFGVRGDGRTDDTAALQKAVDSMMGDIRLDKGVYRITRPIVNLKAPTPEMVDCLVCHDTTGIYRQAGINEHTSFEPDQLASMVRNSGASGPHNCLTCHFTDCGFPANPDPSSER